MKRHLWSRSLTLYLFATVIVVLLSLNLLAIVSTRRLGESARDNILQEHKNLQSLYADQLTREMSQAQVRLNDLCGTYAFSIATGLEYRKGERQYEAMRAQVELTASMRAWLTQFPLINGYFIYNPDTLIIRGDEYKAISWFTEALKSERTILDDGMGEIGRWKLIDTSFGKTLLYVAARHNTQYGVWVSVDKLWQFWHTDSAQYGIVSIAETTPPNADTIDVPMTQIGYTLRRTLPTSVVAVPGWIRALQIVSILMLCALPAVWMSLRRLVILPLKELTKAIDKIEHGDTDYRIPEKANSSEFYQLNHKFNKSIELIARMRVNAYETQLDNERIRVRYLTQQMQPHFVLNTLNLIYSMEPSQYALMQSTIQCLSKYFRYIAHISDPLVPIEAELEHVRNYFILQQTRYPGNFFYRVECPEELLDEKIPPIVIQTFAENAIKHSLTVGVRNEVGVRINRDADGRIHIMIYDSGAGFPAAILEKVRAFQETGVMQEGLGLGIQNTIERMNILYERGAALRLSNGASGGAQVDLYLPQTGLFRS